MNVTDFVNLVINSLKITGKGTGAIQDNGDGTQSAVILTFKEPMDGDVLDLGNGNTSNIHDVKPQTKPSGDNNSYNSAQQKEPNHIVSMEDINTNYYQNSIKEQAQEEAKKEVQKNNSQSTSSEQSWIEKFVDTITNFVTSLVEMLFGKAAN